MITQADLAARVNGDKTRWLPAFLDFLSRIRISSKEHTEPVPIVPYGSQLLFLEALCDGLDEDIHRITCLKARQLGLTTLLLALDIFWLFVHPGLRGALILNTGTKAMAARDTIIQMLDSLPPGFQIPIKKHNRSTLILANGSQLQYLSAGRGGNKQLGRSYDFNFIHSSECSSYGDQEGLDTLQASLAQNNPSRLYIFESTALGFNVFFDMCEKAQEDPTQTFVFIGWWANNIYRFERDSREFEHYWNAHPKLTDYEAETSQQVAQLYGQAIEPEQWAWYRWMSTQRSRASLLEEFPSTELEAFQSTGSTFFNGARIDADSNFIRSNAVTFNAYACELGEHFHRMEISKTLEPESADLRIWEPPVRGAAYVMGVDPAYGSSEEADRTAIEICRCYADKLVQVAEYATPNPTSQQAAWVMAYLAACYDGCMINLELNGPGAAIMQEIKYLKQQVRMGQLKNEMRQVGRSSALDNVRWFLYHRVDSTGGGFAYNWKTTGPLKYTMFNRYRDAYNQDQLIIRSIPLLKEMATLEQDGDKIRAMGRNKDDRAFAMGLATYAWGEWVRPGLMAEQRTFERESARERAEAAAASGSEITSVIIDHIVPNFFAQQAAKRDAAALHRIIEG